jgi:hypothetical protein
MSIKLISSRDRDLPRVALRLKGPGATTVGLYDSNGNALLTKRLVLSGPDGIEATSTLPLSLRTEVDHVALVPVLIHQSSKRQAITFDGKAPAVATALRIRSMKLDKRAIHRIHSAVKLARVQHKKD